MDNAVVTVNYLPKDDQWTVVVRSNERQEVATAPGLIAARDRADRIVEELLPEIKNRTVVHTLNRDALAFTAAYLHARLGLTPKDAEPPTPPVSESAVPQET